MDYFGIIKKAYDITLNRRYLWIFGILAGGAGSSVSSSFRGGSTSSNELFNGNSSDFATLITNHIPLLIIISAVLLALGLAWSILSIISSGALLNSVHAISKGEKNNFKLGFMFGLKKFWRIFAVGLLIGFFVILSIIILVLPIILFVLAKIYVLAIIYGMIVFLADLIMWIYLGMMGQYILRQAVLGNKGSWEAIVTSWDFFKKHLKDILIIYLLLVAVGIVVGIAMILVLLLVGGLLFAIGFALYLASMAVFWMYVAVFGFAFLVFILTLGGVVTTFNSSVYTLAYLDMVKSS